MAVAVVKLLKLLPEERMRARLPHIIGVTNIYIYIYIYIYVYVYIYICMYMYIYVCICMQRGGPVARLRYYYICVLILQCTYVCILLYMCSHTAIYVCPQVARCALTRL
jgi:hypothetical protein